MKDAGAIIHAKTNMGEFASRYVGSGFGVIRNAYDPLRNPSGSSGGTSVGVAANFGMVGIGEDTGGSIRGPAAVASLVGLRPTLELVSRFGLMPANPTTDTQGPITRTVADAAILLGVIAGYDPNDPVTGRAVGRLPESYEGGLGSDGLQGARIGVIRAAMDDAVDPNSEGFRQVRARIDAAVADLQRLGAEVVDPVEITGIATVNSVFGGNVYETEEATDAYLSEHANAPYRTLRSILLSGRVTPWRAAGSGELAGQHDPRPRLPGIPARPRPDSAKRPCGDGRKRPRCARLRHLRPPGDADRGGRGDQSGSGRPVRPGRQPAAEPDHRLPRPDGPRRGSRPTGCPSGSSSWDARSQRRCCCDSATPSSRGRGYRRPPDSAPPLGGG